MQSLFKRQKLKLTLEIILQFLQILKSITLTSLTNVLGCILKSLGDCPSL